MMDLSASSSKFAWLTAPGLRVRPAHDIVVASNDYFVALPSLGSLVPKWLLLVPRRPMSTLSAMTAAERLALDTLRADLTNCLRSSGGRVYAFEHGGAPGGVVSCGVDQAHLHLVPLPFDMLQAARRHDFGWRPSVTIDDLTEVETGGREYLFVECEETSLIGFPQTPVSQWFRRLIAHECGVEEWDYRKNPKLSEVKATAVAMGALRSNLGT